MCTKKSREVLVGLRSGELFIYVQPRENREVRVVVVAAEFCREGAEKYIV